MQLSGSITSPLVSAPQYSVAWACPASVSLVGGDTLRPLFVAPVIVGPSQLISCTATVTGQLPLSPMVLSATTNVLLRDGAAPVITGSNVEPTRMSRFGFLVHANEPLSAAAATATCSPAVAYGYGNRIVYNTVIAGTQYDVLSEGSTCSGFNADLTDTAQVKNTLNNGGFGSGTVSVVTEWLGPYVSTALYDDPRPVIDTLSQVPAEAQAANGVTAGTVNGYELVATQGSAVVRFTGLDLATRPTCEPSCALTGLAQDLGLPGGAPVMTRRASFGGAELFVSVSTDGGIAPLAVRRDPSGAWSKWAGLTGTPGNWNTDLRTVRFDGASQLLVDTWSPGTQSFTTTDVAATGLTEVSLLATANNLVVAAVGPTKQLLVRKRNPADLSWSTFTPSVVPANVVSLKPEPQSDGVVLVAIEFGASGGLSLQRVDSGGIQAISSTAVTGYDVTSWGGNSYIVYALNGDIRFKTIRGSVWSGAGGGPLDFGGPARTGYSPPYPVVLDANPACEAAYPSMAFVEEALVITWQERCSPETKWNVVARTVR